MHAAWHIEPASPTRALLGESPVWDAIGGCVHWLDIPGKTLHRFDLVTGRASHQALPSRITAIAVRADGMLIGCGDVGLLLLDPGSGASSPLAPLNLPRGVRSNDGALAPDGSFWFGTMAEDGSGRPGQLFRYCPETGVQCIVPEIGVPNGPAFLPDGRAILADTAARVLWALDPADPQAWNKRHAFARFTPEDGKPDGMAVDREGCLWVAFWNGACLRRFTADGSFRETLPLPVQRPTRPVFAGPKGNRLFITSAAIGTAPDGSFAGLLLEARPAQGRLPGSVM